MRSKPKFKLQDSVIINVDIITSNMNLQGTRVGIVDSTRVNLGCNEPEMGDGKDNNFFYRIVPTGDYLIQDFVWIPEKDIICLTPDIEVRSSTLPLQSKQELETSQAA